MVIPRKSMESSTGKENLWSVAPKFMGVHDHAVFSVPLIGNSDLMEYPLFKVSRIHIRVIKLFIISIGMKINIFDMME